MTTYLVRRLLIGCLTLVLITFMVFGLTRAMPGDPLLLEMEKLPAGKKLRPEDLAAMRTAYGLDDPPLVAYAKWLGRAVQGDLGISQSRHVPVARLIRERIGPTLVLSVSAIVLAYSIGIPLGLYSSARSGKLDERILSTLLYMLYSLPTFVAALLLLMLFHLKLGWLPLRGIVSDDFDELNFAGQVWDIFLKHALLPVICYTYVSLAYDTRFVRSNMLEVMRQDYIRTARAKGAGPVRVLWHHAFRNTLIPLVTLIGLAIPALLGGAVILETIFTWPGMGNLFFDSIRERDVKTIMGLTLMFSVLTLVGNLLADIMYAVVDPRVAYS